MHGAVIWNPKTLECVGYLASGYDPNPANPGIGAPNVPEGCEIRELAEDWEHPGAAWRYNPDKNILELDEDLQKKHERDSITEKLADAYVESAGLDKAAKAGLDVKQRRADNEAFVKALTDRLDELK